MEEKTVRNFLGELIAQCVMVLKLDRSRPPSSPQKKSKINWKMANKFLVSKSRRRNGGEEAGFTLHLVSSVYELIYLCKSRIVRNMSISPARDTDRVQIVV